MLKRTSFSVLCIAVHVGRLCFIPLNAVECLSSVVRGDGVARFLCGPAACKPADPCGRCEPVQAAVAGAGAMRLTLEALHPSGGSWRIIFLPPPPSFPFHSLFSPLRDFPPICCIKTATIGVVAPRWSSWSHWAAECVWKYLCVSLRQCVSSNIFSCRFRSPDVVPDCVRVFCVTPQTVQVQKCLFWNSYKERSLICCQVVVCGTKWDPGLLGNGEVIQDSGRVCSLCSLTTLNLFWINDGA